MSAIDKIRRILTLVERLQSGRQYNAKELADFCGCSHRTMFRDLRVLQKSGVPVLYDEQRRGYFMTAATFLPPTDLTLQEALALIILTHQLGHREKGIPFQDAAQMAAQKFLSNITGQLRSHIGEITRAVEVKTNPRNPHAGARGHYETMQQALAAKHKVRLRYNSLFEKREIGTLISPYALLYSRHSWYVIGRSSLHRAIRTFHLGRILESSPTEESFTPPPRFSTARHLGLAWHLIREPEAKANVTVRFQPLVASNVAEVTWHPTQKIQRHPDGSIDFTVTVEGIREIAWWILGYGDQAEVLEPPALRKLVAERVAGMVRTYKLGVVSEAETGRRRPKLR